MLTRNGMASCRATLIIFFVFILSLRGVHGFLKVEIREMWMGKSAASNQFDSMIALLKTDLMGAELLVSQALSG
jgi:hypothetical protein